jgi:uncharacterized protein Veg
MIKHNSRKRISFEQLSLAELYSTHFIWFEISSTHTAPSWQVIIVSGLFVLKAGVF